jgi:hypothetical protein
MDVAEMFDELDDSGFTDTTPTRKLGMLNDALYDAASRERWPHLETTFTLSFNGTDAFATNQPADLDTVIDIVNSTTFEKLEWSRLDTFDSQGLDVTQGGSAPLKWYQIGKQLRFYPVPPAGTSLRLRYYRVPAAMTEATLSAAVDWPVSHHRVLTLGALQRLYDMEDDPELAVRVEGKFEERLTRMAMSEFQRQTGQSDRIYFDPLFDADLFD